MFEKSRNKRMLIMQQLGSKNDRVPSAQRRKNVQDSYNNFLKTMNSFKINQKPMLRTAGDAPFFSSPSKTQNNPFRPQSMIDSPSVKDLSVRNQDEITLAKEFYQQKSEQRNSSLDLPTPIKDEDPLKFQQKVEKSQNISDLQALREENSIKKTDLQALREEHSIQKESQQIIADQQIKMPSNLVNKSANNQSNNNSEAIFFTSQFKDYFNKQDNVIAHSPPRQVKQQTQQSQQKKQIKQSLKQQQKWEKQLKNNASGQSLAISNESSFKYSMNQSAIHQAISKKLSNQLVIDSVGDSHVFQKLQNIVQNLLVKQNFKDFIEFCKQFKTLNIIRHLRKSEAFQRLMINKQYNYIVRLQNTKIENFVNQKQQEFLTNCFFTWKTQTQGSTQKIQDHLIQKEKQLKSKVLKTFKMLLFDRRICSQVDMYYLSKIFFAFKTAVEKETKKLNQKAYKFYLKNLKKRTFKLLLQGQQNLQRQNAVKQIAEQHYYFSFMRKVFDGWRQFAPRQEKFIKLAMTTKNILKQTFDHRLLQTKTFDFHQIR